MKSFRGSGIAIAACLTIALTPASARFVTLTGAASQPLGFLAAPGKLVICEGKVVNNKCDGKGVSDVVTFKNDETVGWDSDPKEDLTGEGTDTDAPSALADIPDVTHKAESDLFTYEANTLADPGFELPNSPVVYSFAASVLENEIPEPNSFIIWFSLLAAIGLVRNKMKPDG
jgi:hypothetical protein